MYRALSVLYRYRLCARRSFSANYKLQGAQQSSIDGDSDLVIPDIPRQDRSLESIEAKRGRLLYSSRHRGILETDLLLSTFSKKYLDSMSEEQVQEYDELLEENDWDIYYWATGSKAPPAKVKSMSIWPELFEHSKNNSKQILRMPSL